MLVTTTTKVLESEHLRYSFNIFEHVFSTLLSRLYHWVERQKWPSSMTLKSRRLYSFNLWRFVDERMARCRADWEGTEIACAWSE